MTSRAYSATPAADAPAQSMMIPMADMANHVDPPAESAVLLVARPATPIAWDAKPWLWAAPHTPEDPSRSEPSSSMWCGRKPWPESAILPVPVSPSDVQVHPVHTVKGLSEDGAYFIVLAREPIKKGEQVHAPCGGMPHARHVHAARTAHATCTPHARRTPCARRTVHTMCMFTAHAWHMRGGCVASLGACVQVFVSYGALPCLTLLLQFGFVPPSSLKVVDETDFGLVDCAPLLASVAAQAKAGAEEGPLEHLAAEGLLMRERGGAVSAWQPTGASLRAALLALATDSVQLPAASSAVGAQAACYMRSPRTMYGSYRCMCTLCMVAASSAHGCNL